MPKRDERYIFWLDLETTGSDLDGNVIIEIGAAITDMRLNVLEGREYVINPGTAVFEMAPVVLDMHTKNGLIKDIYKSDDTIEKVDAEIAEWIRKFNGSDHMAFAGSGVTHFDRKFVKRDMPLTDKRLTHWALDVGVIRRTFELILGIPGWPEDTKTHRAYDDVVFH